MPLTTNILVKFAVSLDISKAIDKVWDTGLIFKLKQNGISWQVISQTENIHTISSIYECGTAAEDTLYFLLECPLFSEQRISFMEEITTILSQKGIVNQKFQNLVHTCLYGHSKLSNKAHRNILKATIAHILESNRFS
jgi:hypothetical protein